MTATRTPRTIPRGWHSSAREVHACAAPACACRLRRQRRRDSDIDLAVIATPGWDGRTDLEDAVRTSVGNGCDVLVFTPDHFQQLAQAGEPVVSDILRDGVALVGSLLRTREGVA